MKTMRALVMGAVVLGSMVALAGPGGDKGKWGKDDEHEDRLENREQKARLMYLVAISEALELSDADALKLSDKLKAIEEKRRPLRQVMGESMKALRAAADGDATALTQVDANMQKVLDGRAQMAVMDKEMFASLSQGFSPQKKAKLALVLARLGHEMKGGKKGRRHHR